MSWSVNKCNARMFLALVIIMITFAHSHEAEVSRDLQKSNQSAISEKLIQIRRLTKSLLFDWNLGESGIEGSIGRTFGRMRLIKNIMLPMAFLGGFLLALIKGIALTGIINMLLIGKTLMLQMAIILGKFLYGIKDIFHHKESHHQPYYEPPPTYYVPAQPYYPPSQPHYPLGGGHSHSGSQSYSNAYASSREDEGFYQRPSQSLNSPQYQLQPQFSHPLNQMPNFNQPQQNYNFGQPQSNLFSGISLQTPQQIQSSQFIYPTQQFQRSQPIQTTILSPTQQTQPFNADFLSNEAPTTAQQFLQSMSPQQMTQLLSNAIANAGTTPAPKVILKRSPNKFLINQS